MERTRQLDIEALDMAQEGLTTQDPQFMPLQGTEAAEPEQEQALGEAMITVMELLSSESGLSSVAQIMQQDSRPLYEMVPDVGAMILEKVHGDMSAKGPVDGAVFFGEGGLLQQLPPLLFDVARSIGKPGADDPDQMSAAMIGLYKKAGEHILERGDEQSINEAMKLGQEVMLTQDDGTMTTPEKFQKKYAEEGKKELPARINQNLLGV